MLPQAPSNPDDPASPRSGTASSSPSAVEILDDKGDNRLTLMACHPKYSARQRIVVEAVLVGNPAPVDSPGRRRRTGRAARQRPGRRRSHGPRPGDLVVARRHCSSGSAPGTCSKRRLHGWWRVAPYVVLIPFFAVALYASFENITRLLPGAY